MYYNWHDAPPSDVSFVYKPINYRYVYNKHSEALVIEDVHQLLAHYRAPPCRPITRTNGGRRIRVRMIPRRCLALLRGAPDGDDEVIYWSVISHWLYIRSIILV